MLLAVSQVAKAPNAISLATIPGFSVCAVDDSARGNSLKLADLDRA